MLKDKQQQQQQQTGILALIFNFNDFQNYPCFQELRVVTLL